MNTGRLLLTIALVGGTAVLTATLYGIAALWAASGRKNWLWRWAPLVLLLAALAPIGAYELVALYGTEAAVIIGAISVWRFVRGWRAARHAPAGESVDVRAVLVPPARRVPLQFLLRDVLKVILLTAAVLAIVRYAAAETTPIDWWPSVGAGAALGAGTLAAAWLVCGRGRWYFRVLAFGLITAVAGEVLEALGYSTGVLAAFIPNGIHWLLARACCWQARTGW